MIETEKAKEKLLLVGISVQDGDDAEDSIEELAGLVETAGAQAVGAVIQKRERMHPATYIGKGKAEELKGLIWETQADGIVCDDELTPAQLRNLTDLLGVKVMDRTLVILDIFAMRASTNEGKIQVELAQLRYRASRLSGFGKSMSRLGGGIGTRGPGEKKLEMDRRLIGSRISQLKKELSEVARHREITRGQRIKNKIPVAAIVGYTNAGKSTLLNMLTDAEALEEDMLFATLDPTTRLLSLSGKQQILLTDTVGFIRKLPHHLIEAFKSTLEEAKYADFIIHVVDVSNPQADKQMHIVYETLRRLGVEDKKIVTLLNKQDQKTEEGPLHDCYADYTIPVSAKYGTGLGEVKRVIEELLREEHVLIERMVPYGQAGALQLIRKSGELLEERYEADGIFIRAYVPVETYGKINF